MREVWGIELDDIEAVHLHPKDVGAAIVSFDQPSPPESWRWAGPQWQPLDAGQPAHGIVGADLQSDDPAALAARWAQVLDRPCHALEKADTFAIELDGAQLRFVPDRNGRGPGLSAIALARPRDAVGEGIEICGTQLRFVD
jgi:hypothetical protein